MQAACCCYPCWVQTSAAVGLSAATPGSGWLQSKAKKEDSPFGSAEYSINCLRLKRDQRNSSLVGFFAGDATEEKLPATTTSTEADSSNWDYWGKNCGKIKIIMPVLFLPVSVLPFVSALFSFRLFCDESVLLSLLSSLSSLSMEEGRKKMQQ